MKKIPLTQGQEALVDDGDYDAVTNYRKNGKNTTLRMHVLIFGKGADHKDRNGLNNQRSNLRGATQSQNCANHRLSSNNKSGYKGVSWSKKYSKWVAMICAQGKQKNLGLYPTKESAAKAYNDAAVERFGAFATLNIIPDDKKEGMENG